VDVGVRNPQNLEEEYKMRSRRALRTFLLTLVVFLVGCPQQVKIGDLISNPSHYADKEVTIVGTVTSNFDIFGSGGFELDDGSGKIWVLSDKFGVPSKGVRAGITGRVSKGVNIGGRSLALVIRQTQKPHY